MLVQPNFHSSPQSFKTFHSARKVSQGEKEPVDTKQVVKRVRGKGYPKFFSLKGNSFLENTKVILCTLCSSAVLVDSYFSDQPFIGINSSAFCFYLGARTLAKERRNARHTCLGKEFQESLPSTKIHSLIQAEEKEAIINSKTAEKIFPDFQTNKFHAQNVRYIKDNGIDVLIQWSIKDSYVVWNSSEHPVYVANDLPIDPEFLEFPVPIGGILIEKLEGRHSMNIFSGSRLYFVPPTHPDDEGIIFIDPDDMDGYREKRKVQKDKKASWWRGMGIPGLPEPTPSSFLTSPKSE